MHFYSHTAIAVQFLRNVKCLQFHSAFVFPISSVFTARR